MSTIKTNIEDNQGNSFARIFTFTNETTGEAINITDYSFYIVIKEKVTDLDDDALILKTVTDLTDPEHGIATVALSRPETLAISGNKYIQIDYSHPGATVNDPDVRKTIMKGTILFEQSLFKGNA